MLQRHHALAIGKIDVGARTLPAPSANGM